MESQRHNRQHSSQRRKLWMVGAIASGIAGVILLSRYLWQRRKQTAPPAIGTSAPTTAGERFTLFDSWVMSLSDAYQSLFGRPVLDNTMMDISDQMEEYRNTAKANPAVNAYLGALNPVTYGIDEVTLFYNMFTYMLQRMLTLKSLLSKYPAEWAKVVPTFDDYCTKLLPLAILYPTYGTQPEAGKTYGIPVVQYVITELDKMIATIRSKLAEAEQAANGQAAPASVVQVVTQTALQVPMAVVSTNISTAVSVGQQTLNLMYDIPLPPAAAIVPAAYAFVKSVGGVVQGFNGVMTTVVDPDTARFLANQAAEAAQYAASQAAGTTTNIGGAIRTKETLRKHKYWVAGAFAAAFAGVALYIYRKNDHEKDDKSATPAVGSAAAPVSAGSRLTALATAIKYVSDGYSAIFGKVLSDSTLSAVSQQVVQYAQTAASNPVVNQYLSSDNAVTYALDQVATFYQAFYAMLQKVSALKSLLAPYPSEWAKLSPTLDSYCIQLLPFATQFPAYQAQPEAGKTYGLGLVQKITTELDQMIQTIQSQISQNQSQAPQLSPIQSPLGGGSVSAGGVALPLPSVNDLTSASIASSLGPLFPGVPGLGMPGIPSLPGGVPNIGNIGSSLGNLGSSIGSSIGSGASSVGKSIGRAFGF